MPESVDTARAMPEFGHDDIYELADAELITDLPVDPAANDEEPETTDPLALDAPDAEPEVDGREPVADCVIAVQARLEAPHLALPLFAAA
jgi:hypothetical protein